MSSFLMSLHHSKVIYTLSISIHVHERYINTYNLMFYVLINVIILYYNIYFIIHKYYVDITY